MSKRIIIMLIYALLLFSSAAVAEAATYYVSPNGNDNASGQSIDGAWKSLSKVSSTTFLPGDEILFEAGGVWDGRFYPKGSGEKGKPITIASYGEGSKPVINGGGVEGYQLGGAVSLYNQSWWTIKDIEVTNIGEDRKIRMGISIFNDAGVGEGYVIQNVTVHDVEGGGTGSKAVENSSQWTGGIVVRAEAVKKTDHCRLDSIIIENCTVYDVKRSGIIVCSNWNSPIALKDGSFGTNVTIRNNTVHNIWGDGIVVVGVDGGIIEHNVAYETNHMSYTGIDPAVNVGIWGIHSKNLVFRFNESYLCRTTRDGYGYDVDGDNENITFEYNYSHDNDGGFILLVNHRNTNFNVRYNISQNDHQFGVACAHFPTAHPPYWNITGRIYNNTFYAKEPGKRKSLTMLGRPKHIDMFNNLFYIEAAQVDEYPTDYPYNVDRRNNMYFFGNGTGTLSFSEEGAIIGKDPKFVGAGTGGIGIGSVDGYKLFEDSPAIGAGIVVENNGGRDYFGNPVSDTERPNIGAYNGPGISYDDEEALEIAKKRDIHLTVGDTKMIVAGENIPVDERDATAAPFIENGICMVPLRTVAEALGLTVSWQFETKTTTVQGVGVKMEFVLGENAYTEGGEEKSWSMVPVTKNGIMYVPARDLSDEAGEIAFWKDGTVHITDNIKVYE